MRAFESVPDAGTLTENEKRDYFLQAVLDGVPEVITADGVYKATTTKEMSCEQLKNYLLQVDLKRRRRASGEVT